MKTPTLRQPLLLVLCIVGVLGFGVSAWAGAGGGPRGPFGGDLFSTERLASELALSDAQRDAVEQLMDETRKQARPYVRTLMAQHKAMRALSESDSFDENAVRQQAAQGVAAMTELAVIHARGGFELRKLLTPAQRDKLHDMHGRRHRR
ncbi:MAG: Spy/CpxP family protein refolding chaperone [Proteobacteria bacterium]|nr:Spy/CpxP family protein refolding chaperone [Pseudomonadota bacterium]